MDTPEKEFDESPLNLDQDHALQEGRDILAQEPEELEKVDLADETPPPHPHCPDEDREILSETFEEWLF